MKLKNITTKPFSFESTQIEPGQSKQVDGAIAQKLLALYWHNTLEIDETPDVVEIKPDTAVSSATTGEIPSEWMCCGKPFKSERAMKTHQQISGCKKLKQDANS